jgi:hypothetical protein
MDVFTLVSLWVVAGAAGFELREVLGEPSFRQINTVDAARAVQMELTICCDRSNCPPSVG